jgi:hypothetical protein
MSLVLFSVTTETAISIEALTMGSTRLFVHRLNSLPQFITKEDGHNISGREHVGVPDVPAIKS